jgi:predicted MFS family arabinose efflux permease
LVPGTPMTLMDSFFVFGCEEIGHMAIPKGALPYVGLMAFASMALTRVCDPMLTTLGQDFQIPIAQASQVISWYAIAYGAFQLFFGPAGEKFGKIRIVIWAGFTCAVLSLLAGIATDFSTLLIVRVAMGAAAGAIIPLSMAWIGDLVEYERRQETLAHLLLATVTGMMSGQWLGGLAAGHLGWRWAFFALFTIFSTSSFLLWNCAKRISLINSSSDMDSMSLLQHSKNGIRLFRSKRVRWVLLVTAFEGALAFGPFAFAPSQLVEKFGFSVTLAGAVMMLYGVGGLLYAVSARRWIDILGERGLSLAGGGLIAIALTLLGCTESRVFGAIACGLGGLGFYMLHSTLQTQATQMAPEARGTAVALFVSTLFIGQSIGVSLTALAIQASSAKGFFVGAAIGIFLLGILVSRKVGISGGHSNLVKLKKSKTGTL